MDTSTAPTELKAAADLAHNHGVLILLGAWMPDSINFTQGVDFMTNETHIDDWAAGLVSTVYANNQDWVEFDVD